MRTYLNLIKLEVITIKGKSFLVFQLSFLAIFLVSLFSVAHLLPVMALFAGMANHPIFSIEQQSGYHRLYGSLPIKKHMVVRARFILGTFITFGVALVSVPFGYLAYHLSLGSHFEVLKEFAELSTLMQTGGFTIELASAFCFFAGCIFATVHYTLVFIFGVEKEVPVSMGLMGVALGISFILIKFFKIDFLALTIKIYEIAIDNSVLTITLLLVAGIGVMAIGSFISSFFFCRKEL